MEELEKRVRRIERILGIEDVPVTDGPCEMRVNLYMPVNDRMKRCKTCGFKLWDHREEVR